MCQVVYLSLGTPAQNVAKARVSPSVQDLYVAVTKATLQDEVVPKEKHVRSKCCPARCCCNLGSSYPLSHTVVGYLHTLEHKQKAAGQHEGQQQQIIVVSGHLDSYWGANLLQQVQDFGSQQLGAV